MQSFSKVQTTDRLINQLQSNINSSVSALQSVPLNSGILLQDVDLIMGSTDVYTTLPTVLVGWLIVDVDGAASIYRVANTDPAVLTLNSSAAVTASIFVF